MTLGDSKTYAAGWQSPLEVGATANATVSYSSLNGGVSGATVATAAASIDSILDALDLETDGKPVQDVLCNWGANDVGNLPAEATWEANYQIIIDELRSRYPSARIWLARPWVRNYDAQCDTVAARIDHLVAANPGVVFAGTDERVWLEGGDNGVTMTTDGVHYSTAGKAECARQWQTVLGY